MNANIPQNMARAPMMISSYFHRGILHYPSKIAIDKFFNMICIIQLNNMDKKDG